MATIPTPRTWTVGELLTASKMNEELRDAIDFLLAPPLAHLLRLTNTSVVASGNTFIEWTSADADTDNGWDSVTNSTRYTAQTAGWYDLSYFTSWAFPVDATGNRHTLITRNGSFAYEDGFGGGFTDNSSQPRVNLSGTGSGYLGVGDYIEVVAYVDGSNNDTIFAAHTSIRWVST